MQLLLSLEFIIRLRRKMLKWEIIVSVHTYPPDNNLKKQNNTQISSGALGLGQWMKWRALGSSIFLQ